jgi:hypothetical protein
MKKLVLAVIMMAVPFSAFALDKMSDKALDNTTAQTGVTIAFEGVTISQSAADTAWLDDDGTGAGTTGGLVYLTQSGNTDTTITGTMSIDVATVAAGGTIAGNAVANDTSYVRIALPSVNQSADAKYMTISMNALPAAGADPAAGATALGTLFQDAGTTDVSGNIYIYAH